MTINEAYLKGRNVFMLLNKKDYEDLCYFYNNYGSLFVDGHILKNAFSFQVDDPANQTHIIAFDMHKINKRMTGKIKHKSSYIDLVIYTKGVKLDMLEDQDYLLGQAKEFKSFDTIRRYMKAYKKAVNDCLVKNGWDIIAMGMR